MRKYGSSVIFTEQKIAFLTETKQLKNRNQVFFSITEPCTFQEQLLYCTQSIYRLTWFVTYERHQKSHNIFLCVNVMLQYLLYHTEQATNIQQNLPFYPYSRHENHRDKFSWALILCCLMPSLFLLISQNHFWNGKIVEEIVQPLFCQFMPNLLLLSNFENPEKDSSETNQF